MHSNPFLYYSRLHTPADLRFNLSLMNPGPQPVLDSKALDLAGKWEMEWSIHPLAPCYTFTPNPHRLFKVPQDYNEGLRFNFDVSVEKAHVYVGNFETLEDIERFVTSEKGFLTHVHLSVHESISVPQRGDPSSCRGEPGYHRDLCLKRCRMEVAVKRVPQFSCAVPGFPTEGLGLGNCSDGEMMLRLLWAMHHVDSCNCPRPCRFVSYEYTVFREPAQPVPVENNRIHIYVPTRDFIRYEESESYSFSQMFSEIGGSLGILFGFSLFSGFGLTTVVLDKVMRRKKGGTLVEEVTA